MCFARGKNEYIRPLTVTTTTTTEINAANTQTVTFLLNMNPRLNKLQCVLGNFSPLLDRLTFPMFSPTSSCSGRPALHRKPAV